MENKVWKTSNTYKNYRVSNYLDVQIKQAGTWVDCKHYPRKDISDNYYNRYVSIAYLDEIGKIRYRNITIGRLAIMFFRELDRSEIDGRVSFEGVFKYGVHKVDDLIIYHQPSRISVSELEIITDDEAGEWVIVPKSEGLLRINRKGIVEYAYKSGNWKPRCKTRRLVKEPIINTPKVLARSLIDAKRANKDIDTIRVAYLLCISYIDSEAIDVRYLDGNPRNFKIDNLIAVK